MKIQTATGIAVLLACLGSSAILTKERGDEITGEVVEVGGYSAAQGTSGFDRITVRTRVGETRELLLGEPGSCPGCIRLGDRVRARLMDGDLMDGPRQVRSMRVRRTGEKLTFRDNTGAMVQTRARDGSYAGTGCNPSGLHGERIHGHAHSHAGHGRAGGGSRR